MLIYLFFEIKYMNIDNEIDKHTTIPSCQIKNHPICCPYILLQQLKQQIQFNIMKKYDLQYKMKNYPLAKNINEISRAKILKRIDHNDEYLQSAQQFYKNTNTKRESNIAKLINPQPLKIKIKDADVTVEGSHTKRSDSKITPDNVKRSVERDFTNNLEYWRRETFRYQQLVFDLERKNSDLTIQNNKLKQDLKVKQEISMHSQKVSILNPQKELLQQNQFYKRKLLEIQKQLKMKCLRLQQLQIVLKVVSQKMKEHNPQLFVQLQIAPSLSFTHYISTLGMQNQLLSPASRSKENLLQSQPKKCINLLNENCSARPQ